MHPMDEDLANMALCYMDENGKLHPMQLGTTEIIPDSAHENPFSDLLKPQEMSFTMGVHTKYAKGMFDCLCGRRWTRAAWRYLRLEGRHKEKARRKKLKEGKT